MTEDQALHLAAFYQGMRDVLDIDNVDVINSQDGSPLWWVHVHRPLR